MVMSLVDFYEVLLHWLYTCWVLCCCFGHRQLADGNLEPKKEVATRLVRLEKKMLHACLQAANEFINDLPDHTVSPCPAPYAPELKWGNHWQCSTCYQFFMCSFSITLACNFFIYLIDCILFSFHRWSYHQDCQKLVNAQKSMLYMRSLYVARWEWHLQESATCFL